MPRQWPQKLGDKVELLTNVAECKGIEYKRELTTPKLRTKIVDRDKGKCFLCGCQPEVNIVHHINPAGDSTPDNLVLLCNMCHVWIHRILHVTKGYKPVRTFFGYW